MKPSGDGTYETIFLKGLPTLVASNSDNPPGSFHSKDLFILHATILMHGSMLVASMTA